MFFGVRIIEYLNTKSPLKDKSAWVEKTLANFKSGQPTINSASAVCIVDIEMSLEWVVSLDYMPVFCVYLYEILLKKYFQAPVFVWLSESELLVF